MKKILFGLFAIACSLLLITGLAVSPVLAEDLSVTKPVKEMQVKPTKIQDANKGCEVMRTKLAAKAEKLLEKAELLKAEYDKAAEANEHAIDTNLLEAKQAAVASAIAAAKADLVKLSCPLPTLKTTMKQLEKDLQYVNKALSDYRKTLKGLKGKAERKKEKGTKPVLGTKTCSVAQVEAKKIEMTKLVTSAEKLAEQYRSKSGTLDPLSKAIVQSKRLAFESALRKAKEDITALRCENGSMEKGVKTFKTDLQTALTALKAYRQALTGM